MAALGLTRQDGGKGDVLVRYHAVGRTDVDLKNKIKDGTGPTSDVGKVQVELLGGTSFKQVWQATTEGAAEQRSGRERCRHPACHRQVVHGLPGKEAGLTPGRPPRRWLAREDDVDCWIGIVQETGRCVIRLAGRLSVAQVPDLFGACAERRS